MGTQRNFHWLQSPFFWGTLVAVVWLLTAWINVGFVAIDDYTYLLTAALPPDPPRSLADLVQGAWIHPPLARLWIYAEGRLAWWIGVRDPLCIVRSVYVMNALFSLLILVAGYKIFSLLKQRTCRILVLPCLGLNAIAPYIHTRALPETLSTPFLLLSMAFLCRYWVTRHHRSLIVSVLLLTVASMFRFQVGVGLAVFPVLLLLHKDRRGTVLFLLAAAASFLLSGWLDQLLSGTFHGSVVKYLRFNLENSTGFYGRSGFFGFLFLFLGLGITPLLLTRYRTLSWRSEYHHLFPVLFVFLIFVLSHSFVPHKEPRFMIPAVPLFFILLTPVLSYFFQTPGLRWRFVLMVLLHLLVLGAGSFSIAQNNIVGLVRYFHQHPEVKRVFQVGPSAGFLPWGYSTYHPQEVAVSSLEELLRSSTSFSCEDVAYIRDDLVGPLPDELHRTASFPPGVLEGFIIRRQPQKNARRAAMHLLQKSSCVEHRLPNEVH